jgi:glycosyltransferase involved in cell wall biosynthesis
VQRYQPRALTGKAEVETAPSTLFQVLGFHATTCGPLAQTFGQRFCTKRNWSMALVSPWLGKKIQKSLASPGRGKLRGYEIVRTVSNSPSQGAIGGDAARQPGGGLRFSVVTPSFRSLKWLKLCVASVADQEGVEVEHIVQDSCSDDGTPEWLGNERRVRAFVEKDQGMYDAINRGLDRTSGDILAYLNCDEQYLPGALKAVQDCFAEHPRAEAVLTDTVVTDDEGNYLCHRCSLVPRKNQMWVRFPVLSSGLFVRRHVVQEMGIRFDTRWRVLGDFFWIMEMARRGVRFEVLPTLTSVFADTGDNLCLRPEAVREQKLKWEMAPRWVRLLEHPFILLYRLRLAARGASFRKPFDYSLYTLGKPAVRTVRHAARPTSFWPARSQR